MRRRPRIDLGQPLNAKEETRLERKRERWTARNRGLPPIENPFLVAIKPDHDNYGDPTENSEELKVRLENLEYGNFPGYFNYRKNAAPKTSESEEPATSVDEKSDTITDESKASKSDKQEVPLEAGLSDERLGYMRPEWFANKQVLDVGCNRGHVTYAIASKFSPKFILGIDIDLKMINMANRDLHLHLEDGLLELGETVRREYASRLRSKDPNCLNYEEEQNHFPLSSYIAQGPIASINDVQNNQEDKVNAVAGGDASVQNRFPNNIVFIEHNYVLARDELVTKQKPYFDTILCLSVTKWVHLNYRDAGLKRFFRRMYNHLRAGGLLILEAQPFDNYGRRKKLSERLRTNYHSIAFKPNQFDEYLLGAEVGFREVIYSTTTDHKCTGFKRPLKVFLK